MFEKSLKKILLITFVLSVLIFISQCSDDDSPSDDPAILGTPNELLQSYLSSIGSGTFGR